MEFIDENGGGPGVRLRKWQHKKGWDPWSEMNQRRRGPVLQVEQRPDVIWTSSKSGEIGNRLQIGKR